MPVLGQVASCKACGKTIRSDDVSEFIAAHRGHDKPKAASKPKAAKKSSRKPAVKGSAASSISS